MSPTGLRDEEIERVVTFHGHSCPGLMIGIRAAEAALSALGPRSADEELFCLSETDMCAVDAIQFLTGCTLGKGNLKLCDHGKVAFTFWRRSDGRALRLALKPRREDEPETAELRRRKATIGLTEREQARMDELRAERARRILSIDLEELFALQPVSSPPPHRARLEPSLACERCGENAMESRTRRFMGQTLCIPCFELLRPA